MKTLEHIKHFVEVWRKELSRAILLALNQVFNDIDSNEIIAAELSDDHYELNDIQPEWEELRDDSEVIFFSESELMNIDLGLDNTYQSHESSIEERSANSLIENLVCTPN